MARGRGRGHKGQRRHFTNPDDLDAKRDRLEKEKNWRQRRGDVSDDDSEEEEENKDKEKHADAESGSEGTDNEDDSDSDAKAKGVEGLIEIENPNRVQKKAVKIDKLDAASSSKDETQLSRREREELEKQRARENYARLHAAGKTDQARADLARLALIKQQREEAAKKKEEEKRLKEQELKAKQAQTNKALGKK